jgi:hypothetical protein
MQLAGRLVGPEFDGPHLLDAMRGQADRRTAA